MDPSVFKRRARSATAALLAAAGALFCAGPSFEARAAASDSLTVSITPLDVWPPAPVADLVGSAGAEGQMLLQWTAPDGNNNVLVTSSAAAGYTIKLATYSVLSAGGNTAAWWSAGTEVRNLATPATPPAPAVGGTLQSLLVNGLDPGATYYAVLISSDSVGNVSAYDANAALVSQARALIYDAVPPAPSSALAVSGGPSQFTASWPAVTAFDLDYYRIFVDSTVPRDFADGWIITVDSPTLNNSYLGLSTGTYAVRVTAVDVGSPTAAGIPLESVTMASTTVVLTAITRPAQAPFGLSLSSSGASVTLQWMPVVRYGDLTPFADPSNALSLELSGFRIDRATVPYGGAWSAIAAVSSATLTYTDLAGGPQYYYTVLSQNSTCESERSIVRSVGNRSAYAVAPDGLSHYEILMPNIQPVEGSVGQPMTAYLIGVSSRPEDLGGRVVKSVEIWARQGGQALAPGFAIDGLGRLRLHYDWTGTSVAAAGWSQGVAPTPDNLGVYWYNGTRWIQLFGTLDALQQTLLVETKYIGRYQLRTVERAEAFRFDSAGVSNRMLSPNGDGKNDDVVFVYDNPRDAAVRVRIMDMRGRVVAQDLPQGPMANSLVWNARANGVLVPSGIYIYQIEAEGKSFTGTLVIVR